MKADDIMSRYVHTVEPGENLELIKEVLAQAEYHHLLVEDHDKLVGIISDRDVLKASSPFLGTDKERDIDRELMTQTAKDIMTTEPVTIQASTPISDAASLLLEHTISCLPVVDNSGAIEGIVTWKDILKHQNSSPRLV